MKISSLIAAVLFAGAATAGVVYADDKAAAPKAAEAQTDKRLPGRILMSRRRPVSRKACRMRRPISPTQPRTRASTTIREMESKLPVRPRNRGPSGPHHFSHGHPQTGRARQSMCVSHTSARGRV